MRILTIAFAVTLATATVAIAQDWTEYQNVQDGFKIDFPGQPKITETTWTSEYGYKLPARVYSAERGKERYSMTVVDYNPIEPQGVERPREPGEAGGEHKGQVLDAVDVVSAGLRATAVLADRLQHRPER